MALSKSALLASINKQSKQAVDVDVAVEQAPISIDVSAEKAPTPEVFFTRDDRPPAHAGMPKSNNEMKLWMREQLAIVAKKSGRKLDATMDDYRRKYREMDSQRDATGIIPIGALGTNKNTFYAKRAALIAAAAERGRAALSEISRANTAYTNAKKNGDTALAEREKSNEEKAYQDLIKAGNDLLAYPLKDADKDGIKPINAYQAGKKIYKDNPTLRDVVYVKPTPPAPGSWQAALKSGGIEDDTKGNKSKSRDMARIKKVHANWRDLGFQHVAKKWQTYYAIVSVTGCRPEEVAGIRIMRDREDPTFLRFGIDGAKTNQNHGIETRVFSIREKDSLAFSHLLALAANGPLVVEAPTMQTGKQLRDIKGAFRNACNEAGRAFIRQRKDCPTLSPYCLRHSFASDFKADGLDAVSVAVIMGHSTTKTQRAYGNAANGVREQREIKVDTRTYDIKQNTEGPTPDFMQPEVSVSVDTQAPDNTPTQGTGKAIHAPQPQGPTAQAPTPSGFDFG